MPSQTAVTPLTHSSPSSARLKKHFNELCFCGKPAPSKSMKAKTRPHLLLRTAIRLATYQQLAVRTRLSSQMPRHSWYDTRELPRCHRDCPILLQQLMVIHNYAGEKMRSIRPWRSSNLARICSPGGAVQTLPKKANYWKSSV